MTHDWRITTSYYRASSRDNWPLTSCPIGAVAHDVKDANGRAYNRTKYREQRHKMMQHWSDYLDGLQVDNVVAVKFGGLWW